MRVHLRSGGSGLSFDGGGFDEKRIGKKSQSQLQTTPERLFLIAEETPAVVAEPRKRVAPRSAPSTILLSWLFPN